MHQDLQFLNVENVRLSLADVKYCKGSVQWSDYRLQPDQINPIHHSHLPAAAWCRGGGSDPALAGVTAQTFPDIPTFGRRQPPRTWNLEPGTWSCMLHVPGVSYM